MRFEKQARVNSNKPTRTGVISSPDPRRQDSIQNLQSDGSVTIRNQVPRADNVNIGNVNKSFDDTSSISDVAGSEDFVSEHSARHNRINDNSGVIVHHRKSSVNRKNIN